MEKVEEDMKPKLIGETWRKYPTEKSSQLVTYGLFECQYCGKEFEALLSNVKRGRTKSCGCFVTHGLSSNKFYNTWYNMTQRCTNPNHKAYKDYGARGITVCEEWLDVRNFVDWCESTHPNTNEVSLDRIDVNGNYEPNNCRWADATTQAINQRMMKNNTSGFVGVIWHIRNKNWCANIRINKILKQLGSFKTKEEAVQARDNYITQNKLPHKLSGLTKNEKE